jgi:uncharacterized membrane protein
MKGRFIFFVLLVLVSIGFVSSATLHGAIYDDSYNLLKNVELVINTSPKQNHISKNGLYFFNVPLGTYEINAEKYYQKELIYSTTQVVEISKDGEFNIDILMQKVSDIEIPIGEDMGPSFLTTLRARYGSLFYVAIVLGVVLIGILIFYLLSILPKRIVKLLGFERDKTNTAVKKEATVKEKESEKPQYEESYDPEKVLAIIKEEGGRTTQKDIRKKIPLSEAKVSLMISELEAKGKIQKIKKGRGNIIVVK